MRKRIWTFGAFFVKCSVAVARNAYFFPAPGGVILEYSVAKKVHELYWGSNVNCARTSLICLGDLFGVEIADQTLRAAIGLHGAGGFRAQCGLVEGPLMFIGLYFS